MKLGRETIVGAVSALVVVGLIYWAWSWFVSKPGVDTVAVGIQTAPPGAGITVNQKPFDDWAAMGLPTASRYNGGPPKIHPDQPEPPLADNQAIIPLVYGQSINRDKPDECCNWEIVGRTVEIFGLMKFDLSKLPESPKRAVLRGCVYYIENACGYQTPVKLVFYRLKTDWDDSATYRYASSRDQVEWKSGASFGANSAADVDPTPLATVVIPNPSNPGFNLEADITPLVAGWMSGAYPNHGILMRCDFGVGRSTQGNLATRKYTTKYLPQILCTVSAPPPATTQPVPQVERATVPTTVSDWIRNVITSK